MEDAGKLYSQLYDIEGVKNVSIWPLAPGWWVLIAIAVIFIIYLISVYVKKQRYKKSWRYKTIKRLESLEKNFSDKKKKQIISLVNTILKKAALIDYPRKDVAKLHGKKWLIWLKRKDANNFDWPKRAIFLTTVPYMEEEKVSVKKGEIMRVIDAAKEWVK